MQCPRETRPHEFEQVLAMVNHVFRADLDQNIASDYPLIYQPGNLENLRILLEDGKIVTHLAIAPREVIDHDCHFPVGMVNGVATDPNYRGRGFARRVTEDALAKIRDNGCDFGLLWTATADVYRSAGWEVVGSNGWAYVLSPDCTDHFQKSCAIRACDVETDLEALMSIYESHPFRTARNRSDFRALYSLPKIDVFVAESEGYIQGYLVAAWGVNKEGVVEWGGTAAALESLLCHLLSMWTMDRLQVFVPQGPSTMADLLVGKGCKERIPMEEGRGSGLKMVRVVHLRQLLEHLVPYLEQRLRNDESFSFGLTVTETGEHVRVDCAAGRVAIGHGRSDHEVTLTLRQTAQLIFGPGKPSSLLAQPGEIAGPLDRLFPFDFHVWMLDYV